MLKFKGGWHILFWVI